MLIHWQTVIVSIILSTITAIIIAKLMLDKMLIELNKSDDEFINQLELLKKETLEFLKNRML